MVDSSTQPNSHEPDAASDGEGAAAAASEQAAVRRDILPIPDVRHVGLTTYDAIDPDTTYPASSSCAPLSATTRLTANGPNRTSPTA